MQRKTKIATEAEYDATMVEIDQLMKKGSKNISPSELKKLQTMAIAAEEYEDIYFPLPFPKTIPEMVELKMYQLKLNQTTLAQRLTLSRSKLSQILSGKRNPDLAFIKGAYKILGIDAAFLLEKA